jgi:glycosyltransferase EpsE
MSLSVLMSVYCKEKPEYLQQALESIWDAQTLKPDEIVLVEDGPLTPELYNILTNLKNKLDGVLKRIPLEKNEGLTKALNIGIEHCSGEFIARMDSDDISSFNRFEEQINFLKKKPEYDIVGSFSQNISESGNYINTRHVPVSNEDIEKLLPVLNPVSHPTVVYRKLSIKEIGCYDERFKTSQDYHLWFKAVQHGLRFYNLPAYLLLYRMASNYTSKKSFKYRLNEYKIKIEGYKLINYPWYKYYNAIISLILAVMPSFLFKLLKKIDPR